MKVLETIRFADGKRIDLCQGDLSALPRHEWFDAIVVSAFTGSYDPIPGTVIGALERKGVSVAKLAAVKDVDERRLYGTWMSQEVRNANTDIGFGRVICFEPRWVGSPPRVVQRLFTAMLPIVAGRDWIRSVAMPILATGNQGFSIEEMLKPQLRAAIDALEHGLGLDRVAIVVHGDSAVEQARAIFGQERDRVGEFDVFISYSRKDQALRSQFVDMLRDKKPDIRPFVDKSDIRPGTAWPHRIFDSIDRCRRVVALVTPNYTASMMCLEEFNVGWLRSKKTDQEVLRPVYVRDASLSTFMESVEFEDCREHDPAKLERTATAIALSLR